MLLTILDGEPIHSATNFEESLAKKRQRTEWSAVKRVILLAAHIVLALSLWPGEPLVASSPSAFGTLLADFAEERDSVLLDPSATVDTYRELVERHAGSVNFEALSVEDLASGAFEGLFSHPDARDRAAHRLEPLLDDGSEVGARAQVVRLRLLGVRTVFDQPDPTVRDELASAVLEHPGLQSLWHSPAGFEVVTALCISGCSPTLKRHSDRVDELLAALDPAANLNLAAELDRLVLLALLSATEEAEYAANLQKILAFGQECQASQVGTPLAEEISVETARVQKVADRVRPLGTADLDRHDTTWAELEDVVAQDRLMYARFALYLADVISAGLEAGGEFDIRMLLVKPRQETVFSVAPSVYETPTATEFRAADLVHSADGKVIRAFGGVRLADPAFRLRCSDIGADERRGVGFIRGLRLGDSTIDVRAGEASIDGAEWEASSLRAGLKALGIFLFDVGVDRVRHDSSEVIHIEGTKLRLFHLPVGRFGYRTVEPPAKAEGDQAEQAEETGPSKPRGSSPLIMWLKLPSIGLKEGGISFSYWNALKFGDRYTGSVGISTTKGQSPEYLLGLNYNLIEVTNELDLFMPATFLQEDSLGSYYYAARNQEPLRENSKLFERKLFVGAYTSANRLYKDPEGETRTLSTPVSIVVEGGTGLGNAVGARFQVAYEKARDNEVGSQTRWIITPVLGTRPVRVGRGIHLTLRGEGSTRIGDERYTWYRGVVGATALLHPQVRLSLGTFRSWEEGEPTFPYDEVPEDRGYIARCDLKSGAYDFSYMNQYSTRKDSWVRYQWYVSRTFGIGKTFVAFDERYRHYTFGFSVGIDTVHDAIAYRRVLSAESGPSGSP